MRDRTLVHVNSLSDFPPRDKAQTTKVSGRQDRTALNERLARLEDALFDYDKATIRSDATKVLRSDVEVIRSIPANDPAQKLVIEGHADAARYSQA
jgi:outer membrane protein OmpA-like peptidoglycan-associated protein